MPYALAMRRYSWGLLLAVGLFAGAGCAGRDAEQNTTKPLRIAAATDLQSALPELIERFRSKTGIPVATPTFGASGQLAEQIKGGAPFDVFLAANVSFVRDLAEKRLVKQESVHPYTRGSLVLAVYRELGEPVQGLEDLAKPEVKKIAIANPATAPYGKAGKQALERAGLWTKLEPKIVMAGSVRQALYYVQHGEAEAALVGKAIANVPEVRAVDVDPQLYDPIIQALGIVTASDRSADAERFAKFVLDEEGQSILKQFGFTPPGSEHSGAAQQPKTQPVTR
jgi:molybdate transport system substrate-binding protein